MYLAKVSGLLIALGMMVAVPATGAEVLKGSADTEISQRVYVRGGFGSRPYVRRGYYRPYNRSYYYRPYTYGDYWGPGYNNFYGPRHGRYYRRGGSGVQFRIGF